MKKYKELLIQLNLSPENYSYNENRNVAKLTLIYLSTRWLYDKTDHRQELIKTDLTNDDNFINLISRLSNQNNQIKSLFTHGFEIKKTLKSFSDSDKLKICNYAINIELSNLELIDQLIDLLHGDHYANDVDVIIESILKDQTPQSMLTLGVRNNRFISNLPNEIFIASLSYDMGRWRENLLHILFRANNTSESYLSDLTTTIYPDKHFDCAYLSANSRDKHADYDNEIYTELNKKGIVSSNDCQILANIYKLNINFLQNFIGNTNLTPYHIYQALHQLKPDGKLFLSIRLPELESNSTKQLRRKLLADDLVEACIFVNTERVSPRVILILTRNKPEESKHKVYFINENIYFDGLLKHKLNPEIIKKICNLYKNKLALSNISGTILIEKLQEYNYRLNPSFLVYFNATDNVNAQVQLADVSQINRGPHLFAPSIGFESANTGFWLLTPSGITESGDILHDKLLPISQEDFLANKTAEIVENDILIQTRLTTVKIGLVKQQDLLNRKIIINSNLYRLQINKPQELNPIYMFLLLQSTKGNNLLLSVATGATIKSLSLKELKKLIITIQNIQLQNDLANSYLIATTNYQLAQQEYSTSMQSISETLNSAQN